MKSVVILLLGIVNVCLAVSLANSMRLVHAQATLMTIGGKKLDEAAVLLKNSDTQMKAITELLTLQNAQLAVDDRTIKKLILALVMCEQERGQVRITWLKDDPTPP